MANILHKGQPVTTVGQLPAVGHQAPDFHLTKEDLSDVSLKDFAGKKKILNIFPSLDTGTCALSVKKFNDSIKKHSDAVVINVSNDTPFAMKRFCDEFKIDQAVAAANFRRQPDFGKDYGVALTSGKLVGALSRSVVVLDKDNKVVYTEQVADISNEPNYEKALAAL